MAGGKLIIRGNAREKNSITTLRKAGQILLGLGVLLLFVDLVLRVESTMPLEVTLAQGQPFNSYPDPSTASTDTPDSDPALPRVAFKPITIVPGYTPEGKRTRAKARIRMLDESNSALELSQHRDVKLGRLRLRLLEVGLAPLFALRQLPESDPFTMVVNLNVWHPDAREDSFRITQPPATIGVRFYPDFQDGPEGPSSRSMAPQNPVLQLRIVPDDPSAARGSAFLRPGEAVQFESLELRWAELRYWGLFHITETRGLRLLFIALGTIALGGLVELAAARGFGERLKSTEAGES